MCWLSAAAGLVDHITVAEAAVLAECWLPKVLTCRQGHRQLLSVLAVRQAF
jgi:hypothetical protein